MRSFAEVATILPRRWGGRRGWAPRSARAGRNNLDSPRGPDQRAAQRLPEGPASLVPSRRQALQVPHRAMADVADGVAVGLLAAVSVLSSSCRPQLDLRPGEDRGPVAARGARYGATTASNTRAVRSTADPSGSAAPTRSLPVAVAIRVCASSAGSHTATSTVSNASASRPATSAA